jgi:quinol monooxygenase YgiN
LQSLYETRFVQRTRQEKGCLLCTLCRESDNELSFALFDEFCEYKDFEAHVKSELYTRTMDAIAPLLARQPKLEVFHAIAGQQSIPYATKGREGTGDPRDRVHVISSFQAKSHVAAQQLKQQIEAMDLVAKTRKEPGVLRYTFVQHLDEKSRFKILEEYINDKAANEHSSSEHGRRMVEVIMPLIVTAPLIQFFEDVSEPPRNDSDSGR